MEQQSIRLKHEYAPIQSETLTMLPITHHVPIEEADLRSEELLETVSERGGTVLFYRDGIPIVRMIPAEPGTEDAP